MTADNQNEKKITLQNNGSSKYDDIIGLPHHVSRTHKHMPVKDRAAQFSAFAALSGYEDAVNETSRLTEHKHELDETELEELSLRLNQMLVHADEHPPVSVTYFIADGRKSGGGYKTVTGNLKKADDNEHILVLTDGTCIPFDDIADITPYHP